MHARELVQQVRVEHARRGAQDVAAAEALQVVGAVAGHRPILPGAQTLCDLVTPRTCARAGDSLTEALASSSSAGIASTTWRTDRAMKSRFSTARRALEGGDLDVGQRQELPLGGVEVVGEPAAVAVGRQRQVAGDAVPVGLDDDALGALLHARAR